MRIVRVANFVTERSGGLRTALRQLGAGYRRAGHEAVLVIPGRDASDVETEQGRVITLAGPEVPGMGGYRVLFDRNRTAAVLRKLRPDRLEVSDRTTLRWVGGLGAAARCAVDDGVAREPRRAAPAVRAGARALGGGPAQRADRGGARHDRVHDRLGGGRVRANRRAQRHPRTAGC